MEDKEFTKKLGREIASRRVKIGLSQENLAGQFEADQGYLSDIETGKANVSILYLKKIAETLGVEPWELLKF